MTFSMIAVSTKRLPINMADNLYRRGVLAIAITTVLFP